MPSTELYYFVKLTHSVNFNASVMRMTGNAMHGGRWLTGQDYLLRHGSDGMDTDHLHGHVCKGAVHIPD